MRAITTRSLCLLVLASLGMTVGAFEWTEQIVVASIRAAGLPAAAGGAQRSSRRPPTRPEIERLRREQGIKAVAKLLGRYESAARVERVEKDIMALDLPSVADRSDLIIRGVVVGRTSSVSEDGAWLVTDHEIQVNELFDGVGTPGEIISLRLPGGRVQFEDGSVAEIPIDEFRGMELGPEYVLFLARSRGSALPKAHYELAWGTQAAFELTPAGRVSLLGPAIASVPKLYRNKPTKDLLADIRAAVLIKRKFREGK